MRDVMILLFVALAAWGCGGEKTNAADIGPSSEAASTSATDPSTQAASSSQAPRDIEICDLLSDEQVATVLPGHDGGMEVVSGEQLFGDETRSYKCSYGVEENSKVYHFTIDLTAGSFGVMSYRSGLEMARQDGDVFREVDVGDGGWVERGDEYFGQGVPYARVTVLKDSTEISVELMAPSAHEKTAAVVDLAAAVASALGG